MAHNPSGHHGVELPVGELRQLGRVYTRHRLVVEAHVCDASWRMLEEKEEEEDCK